MVVKCHKNLPVDKKVDVNSYRILITVKFFNEEIVNAMTRIRAHAVKIFALRKGMYTGNISALQKHYRD